MKKLFILWFLSCGFTPGYAIFMQSFHYRNMLIGDRAAGLGGAFTAIADDPSGGYYNPAGLAFSQNDDVSASVNAYSTSTVVYKDILGTIRKKNKSALSEKYQNEAVNFTETTADYFPSFVGGLQTLGNYKLGFSVVTELNRTLDQNDNFDSVTVVPNSTKTLYRTFQMKESKTLAGPSLAFNLTSSMSVGVTLYTYFHKIIVNDFQLIINNPDKTFNQSQVVTQNNYMNIDNFGVIPIIGFQAMLKSFSLGISLRKGINISDSNKVVLSLHKTLNGEDHDDLKTAAEKEKKTASYGFGGNNSTKLTGVEEDNPIEIFSGIGWYATSKLLISADYTYHDKVKPGSATDNRREAVQNWAVGSEYYLATNWPLRLGAFSNSTFTPEIIENKSVGLLDHLNYYGGSCSISWATKEATITIGGIYQIGSGKSQKLGDSAVQNVDGKISSVYFSGSYSI